MHRTVVLGDLQVSTELDFSRLNTEDPIFASSTVTGSSRDFAFRLANNGVPTKIIVQTCAEDLFRNLIEATLSTILGLEVLPVELNPDPRRPNGWKVSIKGTEQSANGASALPVYVDLLDPKIFEDSMLVHFTGGATLLAEASSLKGMFSCGISKEESVNCFQKHFEAAEEISWRAVTRLAKLVREAGALFSLDIHNPTSFMLYGSAPHPLTVLEQWIRGTDMVVIDSFALSQLESRFGMSEEEILQVMFDQAQELVVAERRFRDKCGIAIHCHSKRHRIDQQIQHSSLLDRKKLREFYAEICAKFVSGIPLSVSIHQASNLLKGEMAHV